MRDEWLGREPHLVHEDIAEIAIDRSGDPLPLMVSLCVTQTQNGQCRILNVMNTVK